MGEIFTVNIREKCRKYQQIDKRLKHYEEWAKDMPVGEMIPHKPAHKYVARDYCSDVKFLLDEIKEFDNEY